MHSGQYNFICHNCGESSSFISFLRTHNPLIYQSYKLDVLREGGNNTEPSIENIYKELDAQAVDTHSILHKITRVGVLAKDHPARQYLIDRKIPLDNIFFTDKYVSWANSFQDDKYGNMPEQERIIFPWYDVDGTLSGYSARAINGEQPKYYTFKVHKDAYFGLHRIDQNKLIYIVEGQIDSLFVDNCIAAGSSALHKTNISPNKSVLIPDRDIRNIEIMKLVDSWIDLGYNVCLLPETFIYKDINDAIVAGVTKEELMNVILKNTFNGMKARMIFNIWRRDV